MYKMCPIFFGSREPIDLILHAFFRADDVEVFMLYFLFAGTSYGCHFDEAFGIALYSMAIVQVAQ